MERKQVCQKFGDDYITDDMTFKMGIDIRFADHLAARFKNYFVLETCTGGGFSTISLAKYASHVYCFEIDGERLKNAIKNVEKAKLANKVTFINDDVLNIGKYSFIGLVNAAYIDPDWAVTGPNHVYKFLNSNTRPPSDVLFNTIYQFTKNITLIQPPFILKEEFINLPKHEFEILYMDNKVELFCLHFGDIQIEKASSEFRV